MSEASFFLSYARRERSLLNACVCESLDQLRLDYWIDERMSDDIPGDWWVEIAAKITKSTAFVFLLTAGWQQSIECRREFETAKVSGRILVGVQPFEIDFLPQWMYLRRQTFVIQVFKKGEADRLREIFAKIHSEAEIQLGKFDQLTQADSIDAAVDKIRAENSKFKILGRGRELTLTDFFLPLKIVAAGDEPVEPVKLDSLITWPDRNRSILVGGPGSGKSTALQYLQVVAASSAEPAISLRVSFSRLVQMKLNIGEWAEKKLQALFKLSLSDLTSKKDSVPPIIFVDGFDEISDDNYDHYRGDLLRFADEYPRVRLLVTSRPGRFEPSNFPDFNVFNMAELGLEDVTTYIESTAPSTAAASLLGALKADARLAELARTPFMLALICASHVSVSEYPRERSLLYRSAIDFLLKGDDWEKRARPSSETLRRWRSSLQRIALRLFMLESDGQFKHTELLNCIEVAVGTTVRADSILSEIVEMTGLLQMDRDGYSFVHRSLWEFFVAEASLGEPVQVMAERAGALRWEEPIRLYAGLIPEADVGKVFRGIWEHNPALALRCMSERSEFPSALLNEFYTDSAVRDRVRIVADLARLHRRSPTEPAIARMVVDTGRVIAGVERDSEVLYNLISLLRKLSNRESSELQNNILQFDSLEDRVVRYLNDSRYYFSFSDIRGGRFTMGADDFGDLPSDASERPAHEVQLLPFYVCKYLVTNILFYKDFPYALDRRNEYSKADRQPVNKINWYEAVIFSWWLGGELLTDAQWEYMARGEQEDDIALNDQTLLPEFAWYGGNADNVTHDVGTKNPSSRGVYDVAGNLREWCMDWYSDDFYSECKTQGIVVNPTGPLHGDRRVLRGGTFDWALWNLRPTYRNSNTPDNRNHVTGFRIAASHDSPISRFLRNK